MAQFRIRCTESSNKGRQDLVGSPDLNGSFNATEARATGHEI